MAEKAEPEVSRNTTWMDARNKKVPSETVVNKKGDSLVNTIIGTPSAI